MILKTGDHTTSDIHVSTLRPGTVDISETHYDAVLTTDDLCGHYNFRTFDAQAAYAKLVTKSSLSTERFLHAMAIS
jgi:hypothetical protein